MQNLYNFKRLNFLTAGMPLRTGKAGYTDAFEILEQMELDGMELEFVHGVRMPEETRELVKKISKEKGMFLTAHGPFYINLNSKEEEKTEASVKRVTDTAIVAKAAGAYSITYHAAYYMGKDKAEVYNQVAEQTKKIISILEEENINIWVRPETTGKATQWGDLDEIIKLSNDFEQVLPCIDFSHLHARYNGTYNTYDEFSYILERIGKEVGTYALANFHGHLAGIEYTKKGERKHLIVKESDMNYKDLLRAIKDFGVKGVLVCESPNIEEDCKLFKEYYMSL